MIYYTTESIQNLIDNYISRGGEVLTIQEGCLGYGLTLLVGEGLKTFVIQEHYLNEWSSGNTVRGYNKTPLKYQKMIDEYYSIA